MSSPPPPYLGDAPVPEAGVYRGESPAARLPGWAARAAWRNRHVTIPLAAGPVMLAAGQALAHLHAGFDVPVIAAAAGVTAWFTAPAKWDAEPRWRWRWSSEVTYVRATVIGAGAWLTLASFTTPGTAADGALGAATAAWGVVFWWHKRPRNRRARRKLERETAQWNLWWMSHAQAWGIGGSHVTGMADRAATRSLLIQLVPGRQSPGDVKRVLGLIESALAGYVSTGMTRVEPVRSNPSQAWLHLKRADPLRETVAWQDSMAPADITKPAPLGVRETGEWLTAVLRAGWLILGRSRAGKSNELSVILATVTRCRNARFILIDLKGGRAARPWLAAATWVATTIAEARLALGCMVAEVAARGEHAYNGEEQLTPTEDCPAWFVVVDEAYWVTSEMAGDARCAAMLAIIASAGQGVEIYPVVLSQYGALAETVRTEQTRSSLNRRLCFQTEDRAHGTFALGDDAHTLVDTTRLAEKGQFYYRANARTSPEQVRGPEMTHAAAREIAVRNAAVTGVHGEALQLYCGAYDSDTGETWQQVFNTRWERLPAAFRADAPQAGPAAPPAEEPMTKIIINSGAADPADELVAAINAEVAELDVTSGDVDRAAARRAARGDPPVDLASEFGARKARFAAVLTAAPEGGISPAELRRAAGMSESWVHLALAFLVRAGAVTKAGRARYAPNPGSDITAAIEAMRRESDTLAAQARDLVAAAGGGDNA